VDATREIQRVHVAQHRYVRESDAVGYVQRVHKPQPVDPRELGTPHQIQRVVQPERVHLVVIHARTPAQVEVVHGLQVGHDFHQRPGQVERVHKPQRTDVSNSRAVTEVQRVHATKRRHVLQHLATRQTQRVDVSERRHVGDTRAAKMDRVEIESAQRRVIHPHGGVIWSEVATVQRNRVQRPMTEEVGVVDPIAPRYFHRVAVFAQCADLNNTVAFLSKFCDDPTMRW
ncbi:hypothetical protein H310_08246, partial [Aphanomyces invadans]